MPVDPQILAWMLGLLIAGLLLNHFRKWRNAKPHSHDLVEPLPVEDLFQNEMVGYLQVDVDGIVRNVNRQECKLRGLAPERIFGRQYADMAAPGASARVLQELRTKLAQQGPLVPYEEKLVRPDGSMVITEVHETFLLSESGHVTGMRFARIDVTERHRSAEEAVKSASELKALFQAFPDLFLRLNAEGKVLECNGGNTKDPFLDPRKFSGRALDDVLPATAAESIVEAIGRVRRTNALEVIEYSEESRLGTEAYECRILPLYWDCVIAVLRNITARRIAQQKLAENAEELKRKNEELESALTKAREATRMKNRFLANMTHELRTPMNGVLGTLDLMLTTPLAPEQLGYAKQARQSGSALLALLNDVLDLSNLEAGALKIDRAPFDLAATLEESGSMFALRATAKGLKFTSVIAPDVPTRLVGDRARLRQVLAHLLGNAIKFTERGEVSLALAVVHDSTDTATLRFSILDTGIGIPRDQQHRLFQSFTQADDSASRKYDGAGLGLAISKQVVELLGGEIGVRSEPGRGSTFFFTAILGKDLQAHAASAPRESIQPAVAHEPIREPVTASAESLRRLSRILLAEDNKVNQRITLRLLEKLGFAADAVVNGREAVDALAKHPYDLVLMDCQMPDMDGFEATAVIRNQERHGRHTPICALTANSMDSDRERCLSAGMDDFMSKPIGLDQLKLTIEKWISPAANHS